MHQFAMQTGELVLLKIHRSGKIPVSEITMKSFTIMSIVLGGECFKKSFKKFVVTIAFFFN